MQNTFTESERVPSWRIPEIDGLRALAIFMVLLCHAYLFAGNPNVPIHVLGYQPNLMMFFGNGSKGVDLFMVLSGFCLFFPLCKTAESINRWNAATFYQKRVKRIIPPYYMAIVYSIVFPVALVLVFRLVGLKANWQKLESPSTYIAHFLFLQTVIPSAYGKINAAFWSMALEVQFYILFPLVIFFYRRFYLWTLALMVSASLIYQLAIQQIIPHLDPQIAPLLFAFFLARWMQFAAGMGAVYIVAYYRRLDHWKDKSHGNWMFLSGVILYFIATTGLFPKWIEVVLLSLTFALFMVALCISHTLMRPIFDNRFMRWMGYISYSVFLTHWPTLYYTSELIEKKLHFHGIREFIALCIIGFPLVILFAYGFFLLFEKPFLNKPTKNRVASSQAIEAA